MYLSPPLYNFVFAPILLFPRTENPKLCSQNAIKVQLPHFLSPTEALEPTLCLMRNLLRILSILKAVFLVQRPKTFKPTYLKIAFSTYVGNSQDTGGMFPYAFLRSSIS